MGKRDFKTAAERRQAERRAWDEKIGQSSLDPATAEAGVGELRTVYEEIFDFIGPLEGKTVLDCGSGEGFLTRDAAWRGAIVYGFDISPESLVRARSLSKPEHEVGYVCSGFEQLPFRDSSFDAAMGMLVLHHVDLQASARELYRVLKPGGRACFVETWMLNPLIRAARRFRGRMGVAQWGTEDERPLVPADLEPLRRAGLQVELAYPGFVFLSLLDRNVLKERWPTATRLLRAADRALGRIPPVRPLGFYCLVKLTRPI